MSPNEHVLQLDMKTLQDSLLEAQTNAECNLLHFNEIAAYNAELLSRVEIQNQQYNEATKCHRELRCDLARHRVAVEGLQNDVVRLTKERDEAHTDIQALMEVAQNERQRADDLAALVREVRDTGGWRRDTDGSQVFCSTVPDGWHDRAKELLNQGDPS